MLLLIFAVIQRMIINVTYIVTVAIILFTIFYCKDQGSGDPGDGEAIVTDGRHSG